MSPSSAGRDPVRKRALYEKHGVRGFWIVHPVDRVVAVFRLGADGRYGPSLAQALSG